MQPVRGEPVSVAIATREVLASTAMRSTYMCEPKPTVFGDAGRRANYVKMLVYQEHFDISSCPRCGDRCGDALRRLFHSRLACKMGLNMVH
jgi:hypothetical protein